MGWTATLYGCTGETSQAFPTAAQIEAAGTYAKIQFGTDTDYNAVIGSDFEPFLIDDNLIDIDGNKRSKKQIRIKGTLKLLPKFFPTSAKTLQKFWYIQNSAGNGVLTKDYHYIMFQSTYYLQDAGVTTPGTTFMKIAITNYAPKHDYESGLKYMEIEFERAGNE